METARCKTCPFWVGQQTLGTCHRLPPTPFYVGGRLDMAYPVTTENDWCAEHPHNAHMFEVVEVEEKPNISSAKSDRGRDDLI